MDEIARQQLAEIQTTWWRVKYLGDHVHAERRRRGLNYREASKEMELALSTLTRLSHRKVISGASILLALSWMEWSLGQPGKDES